MNHNPSTILLFLVAFILLILPSQPVVIYIIVSIVVLMGTCLLGCSKNPHIKTILEYIKVLF